MLSSNVDLPNLCKENIFFDVRGIFCYDGEQYENANGLRDYLNDINGNPDV